MYTVICSILIICLRDVFRAANKKAGNIHIVTCFHQPLGGLDKIIFFVFNIGGTLAAGRPPLFFNVGKL